MLLKFKDIVDPKYHNKTISVRCMIAGKSLAPYQIPKVVEIRDVSNGKSGKWERAVISPKDEKILYFIDITVNQMPHVLRQVLGIQYKKFEYRIVEVQYVERIFFHQIIGEDHTRDYQTRMGYMVGHRVESNRRYILTGYPTVDPSNQTITFVFVKYKALQSDVESFNIVKERRALEDFRIRNPTTEKIYEHLERVYRSYAANVTKIYHRMDLHLAVDLVFHSVMEFRLADELVKKGWMDVMIVGDPRCGKGYVASRLVDYYGVGEVVSAENSSYAGLVAGLEQYQRHWVVKWGAFPMNDCGLLVVDEAGNLNEDWSRLSRIRSEGIAEVTKIHTQVTNARTRLIFIANPIMKTISNYSYGVQSLMDIVKCPEDIARFDYALVVAHDEVPVEEINAPMRPVQTVYSRNLERKLVLWAWSRKGDQVVFTEGAVKLIYEFSIRLANEYDFSIPLIQGENIRIKLARVAIAFAARCYSASKDGSLLIVSEPFVECAFVFFHMIYKKSSSGYFTYSKLKISQTDMEQSIRAVKKYLYSWKNYDTVMRCLLVTNNITVNDLVEYLNQPKEIGTEIVSMLLKHNCLIKKYNYYVKTPIFTAWLKEQIFGKEGGDE